MKWQKVSRNLIRSSTHTPGPWYAHGTRVSTWETQDEIDFHGDEVIAETGFNANARLIAAAPDLYEALRNLVADWERCIGEIPHDHEAREILAKVEGGEG